MASLAKSEGKVIGRTNGWSMWDPQAENKREAEGHGGQSFVMEVLIDSLVLENKTHPDLRETLQEEVQAWVEKSTQIDVNSSSLPLPSVADRGSIGRRNWCTMYWPWQGLMTPGGHRGTQDGPP